MIAKKLLTTIAFALVLLFSGCAKDDFVGIDGLCPVVTSTNPDNIDTNVPLNKVISATFNEKMNPSTITDASFTVGANGVLIDGTVSLTDSKATFTPSSLLDEDTEYTGTITTLAKDERGNALQEDYVWTFTTGNSLSLPVFTVDLSSSPTDGGLTAGAGSYDEGETVTVTATPNADFTFVNWTDNGNMVSTNADYTFDVIANTTLVANFIAVASGFTLDVTAVNGTVLPDSIKTTYNDGDIVILTPEADPNYVFDSWSGDATGNDNPLTVTMDANKNITANFILSVIGATGPGVIDLGTAGDFVILSKSGISTTGVTSITGNIGVSPIDQTAITGFSQIMDVTNTFSTSSYVDGKIYASDYTPPTPTYLSTAISDQELAFTTAMGLTTNVIVALGAGDISGKTLAPGLYKWDTGLLITNQGVTLEGGPDDTWVFQIADDFTIDNDAIITLAGGAQAKNIFWITSTQALIGSNVQFKGNILAQTLISVNTGATVNGKLLSQSAVTLNTATVIDAN